MSEYTRKNILSAIADCDRYIAKESARADDLRPAEIQQRLSYYISHRAKLAGMLT